jgi:L-ascorbate metabolism protein UlaG (beta-lactamase superfamily)
MAKRWKRIADWAKSRQFALRLADQLGRGRGRLRFIDRLYSPLRSKYRPTLEGWADRTLSAVWIGHATVLLRIGGKTVLTDPVMSLRVGLGLGLATAGPLRLIAPALTVRELPPIDLILLSHAHFDHLDKPTLSRMSRRTPVITAPHTTDLISDLGFYNLREIGWGQSVDVAGLKITAKPVAHWGARTFFDQHRGFNAYLIESAQHRVLYGGDTAYHDGFRDIGMVDLAILGIGAYDPYVAAHATPEEAWEMAGHVQAKYVLPIHHSTFRLSYEPVDEPLRRLLTAAGPDAHRVVGMHIGEEWKLAG